MANFIDIFESLKKEYHFRIKSIVDLDKKIDGLERILNRYDMIEMGRVRRTIIQDAPLEFSEIEAHEVYIVDAVLGLPISPYSLKVELAQKLNINQDFIVVRSDNDPLEIETNRLNAMREMDQENEGLEPATLLSTDSEMPEESLDGNLFYGDEYNTEFKKVLAAQSKERNAGNIVKTGSSLFKWLETDQKVEQAEDFNKDIPDAPKVVNQWDASASKERRVEPYISNVGNLDQDSVKYTKRYKKPTGDKVVSKNSDSMRK